MNRKTEPNITVEIIRGGDEVIHVFTLNTTDNESARQEAERRLKTCLEIGTKENRTEYGNRVAHKLRYPSYKDIPDAYLSTVPSPEKTAFIKARREALDEMLEKYMKDKRMVIREYTERDTIKNVGWRPETSVDTIDYAPVCPNCGELAYEPDKCVFCGQRYRLNWSKRPKSTLRIMGVEYL